MKQNIIFWITGQMIHFGIANSIQKNLNYDLFAIYDVGNNPKKFFEQQKFVKFQKTWFYHDYISKNNLKPNISYLKKIESTYNLHLWQLAHNERLFNEFNDYYKFSTDEILLILEQECRLFEKILEEANPKFLIMEPPNLHSEQLFYEMCKSKGIQPLMLGLSRFGYKSIISSVADKLDYDINDLESFQQNRTLEELKKYQKDQNFSKNIKEFTNETLNSKTSFASALIQYLLSNNENIHSHYSYYGRTKFKVLSRKFLELLKKKYRQNFIDKNLIKKLDYSTPFIYYPMFAEPEKVILLGAPFWTNQLEIIKQISKSIPIDHKLFVKEHPMMFILWRKTSFYKEIMKLPNVILIHPSVSSKILMEKCSLVISTAGTSALESIFYGKSAITFVDTGLDMIPYVHVLESINDLPNLIKNSLNEKVDPLVLNKYVNLIEKQSIDFNYLNAMADYSSHFYYGGFLVGDAKIENSQMDSYLKKNISMFDNLAIEHLKLFKD